MPPVTLLIKPASSSCNLRCKYCFYHSIAESRSIGTYGVMSYETLELLVKRTFEYTDSTCTIAFQGGEPTLAGLDFFKKLVEYVKANNTRNIQVNYAIQTNGILINEEWAEFLAENKFLVGISLDGPKDIHDSTRLDIKGKGSFNKVMHSIGLFNKHHVEYNILCVINSYTARHINKVYNFFKNNGFKYLQFIPCLDPLGEKPGGYEYSLTPERYSYFLKNLFDMWYIDMMQGNMISIRYFDNLIGMLMGYPPEACGMSGECTAYFVVEADGSVFPCDFYVLDKWYMGNIIENNFEILKNSDVAGSFAQTSRHIDPGCMECRYFSLCRGGCRRNRDLLNDGKLDSNYFCQSYREFFEHAMERMIKLSKAFSTTR